MTIMEGRGVIPIEHEIGEWVKYCEHSARITALEAERDEWKKREDPLSYKHNYIALEAEVQKLREALEYAVDYLPMETVARKKARAALNSNAGEKETR